MSGILLDSSVSVLSGCSREFLLCDLALLIPSWIILCGYSCFFRWFAKLRQASSKLCSSEQMRLNLND